MPDDYGATTSSFGTIAVGSNKTGSIEDAGDKDWFQIFLTAANTYEFVTLEQSGPADLSDTTMRGLDANGVELTNQDFFHDTLYSRIIFTPSQDGFLFIEIGGSGPKTGDYTVLATVYSLSSLNGDDFIVGTSSADTLKGGLGNDWITGADGDDSLFGQDGADVLIGDAGNDLLNGSEGNDVLKGGDGNDILQGEFGADWIEGGNGNDQITGGAGNDQIYGEQGNDVIFGQGGNDNIFGGDGADQLHGEAAQDWIEGGAGDDLIQGGDSSDVLIGDDGNDNLFGGATNDVLKGGSGSDYLIGDDSVTVGGGDWMEGGDGGDSCYGRAGNDVIFGGAGNDVLLGEEGNDLIFGNAGGDNLYGGSGQDQFIYQVGLDIDGIDAIEDFQVGPGGDFINLDTLLGNAGYSGNDPLADGYIAWQQVGAHTNLYIDLNGGNDQNQLIAVLVNVTASQLSLNNFIV